MPCGETDDTIGRRGGDWQAGGRQLRHRRRLEIRAGGSHAVLAALVLPLARLHGLLRRVHGLLGLGAAVASQYICLNQNRHPVGQSQSTCTQRPPYRHARSLGRPGSRRGLLLQAVVLGLRLLQLLQQPCLPRRVAVGQPLHSTPPAAASRRVGGGGGGGVRSLHHDRHCITHANARPPSTHRGESHRAITS
jgi:hypothetical protein